MCTQSEWVKENRNESMRYKVVNIPYTLYSIHTTYIGIYKNAILYMYVGCRFIDTYKAVYALFVLQYRFSIFYFMMSCIVCFSIFVCSCKWWICRCVLTTAHRQSKVKYTRIQMRVHGHSLRSGFEKHQTKTKSNKILFFALFTFSCVQTGKE